MDLHSCCILANAGLDHGFAAWVLADEFGHVVDDTRNGDQATSVAALVGKLVPFHNGELVERHAPIELGALLVEFLLGLLEATFLDLILLELLKIVCKPADFHSVDKPLRRVVLMPRNGVPVVRRKFLRSIELVYCLHLRP